MAQKHSLLTGEQANWRQIFAVRATREEWPYEVPCSGHTIDIIPPHPCLPRGTDEIFNAESAEFGAEVAEENGELNHRDHG
jgi:hypothetical protein